MPFELEIERVRYGEGEVAITGRLRAGAYAGPETVVVPIEGAGELTSVVTRHEASGSLAWPLEPAHGATVTLGVRWEGPPPRFWRPTALRVDRRRPLVGVGAASAAALRVEASDLLRDPRFWSLVLYDLLERREDDDPDLQQELLGIGGEAVNAWYVESIDRALRAGTSFFVRIPLERGRALEYELAGGLEYQSRYWVCVGERRALAGYHSGHFSLPAFRLEEALGAGAGLPADASAMLTALMLTGCWAGAVTPELTAAIAAALRGLPGVRTEAVARAAPRLAGRLVAEDGPAWALDPARGWVNDGVYSQRNPASRMSVLGDEGFATIRAFFGAP